MTAARAKRQRKGSGDRSSETNLYFLTQKVSAVPEATSQMCYSVSAQFLTYQQVDFFKNC